MAHLNYTDTALHYVRYILIYFFVHRGIYATMRCSDQIGAIVLL